MSKAFDEAIQLLDDLALDFEQMAGLLNDGQGLSERAFRRKSDELRAEIARLERNALAETWPQAGPTFSDTDKT